MVKIVFLAFLESFYILLETFLSGEIIKKKVSSPNWAKGQAESGRPHRHRLPCPSPAGLRRWSHGSSVLPRGSPPLYIATPGPLGPRVSRAAAFSRRVALPRSSSSPSHSSPPAQPRAAPPHLAGAVAPLVVDRRRPNPV